MIVHPAIKDALNYSFRDERYYISTCVIIGRERNAIFPALISIECYARMRYTPCSRIPVSGWVELTAADTVRLY